MPKIFRQSFQIRHYECDAYGHLNNANYLRYMQEAAFNASADVGFDLARYRALGSYWLIRYTDIEYQRALRYGDRIVVETWGVPIRIPAGLREDFNQNFASGSVSF